MNIGIFGGSFDPPHSGHASILKYCRKEFLLNKIIVVPTGYPPHKNKCEATAMHRYEMCRLAFSDCEISDYEIKKQGYSYSAEMLEYFGKIYPGDTLHFIIGGDSAAYIDKWFEPHRIFKAAKIIVAARNENDFEEVKKQEIRFNAKIHMLKNPIMPVSSTYIREALKAGKPLDNLLCGDVIDYIFKNKLYR